MPPLNKIQIRKIRFIIALFALFGLGMFIMLIKWAFIDNAKYLAIANERYKQITIPSIRGSILADDGTPLAYSEPRFDAYVWTPELETYEKAGLQTRDEFLIKVAPILGASKDDLFKILSTTQQWIKIGDKITDDQRGQLLDLKTDKGGVLRGIQFQYTNKRIYPEGRLASQVIGYVMPSDDPSGYKGAWGLELYWNGSLKPQSGYMSGEYDSFGNYIALGQDETIQPKPGATIYTTINKELQASLEASLKSGVDQFKAKSATGIIMDPKTGKIMAMANYPDFDPNNYSQETDMSVFGNLAVSTPYEIGSVGKIFTYAAALDQHKLTPDTVVLPNGHKGCEVISPDPADVSICFNPSLNKTGKIVDCTCIASRQPVSGPVTAAQALSWSDNIGLRHIAMSMSYQEFYNYLIKFGVGSTTSIDTAGESAGTIKTPDKWNYADQSTYSYGQGYNITPIEAVEGIDAVANYGIRMQPYLVSKIVDTDGKTISFNPKVEENVIQPSTAEEIFPTMHDIYLSELIENRYKSLSKYYIVLKSGTGQVANKDKAGYSNKVDTTFAGFDASPDRKFIMLIKLEEPAVGELSWQNVRIVWLDMLEQVINILKVQQYSP